MDINLQNTIDDLVGSLMYYDRKEDEDLPNGAIETMIKKDPGLVGEIVERFKTKLIASL